MKSKPILQLLLFSAVLILVLSFTLPVPRVSANVYDCPSWISVTRTTALPRWQLTGCIYQDESESGGNHNLYFSITDELHAPANVYACQWWPDPAEAPVCQLALNGVTNFGLYGGPFYPDRGEVGAYCGYIKGDPSDETCGMGLPANRHVNFILIYQRVIADPTPTATATTSATPTIVVTVTVTPTPTSTSGDALTKTEFIWWLRHFADEMEEK